MQSFDSSLVDHASDVEHSNAFKILNTLVDEGLITEERADYLKEKFKELHSHVLSIYRRDNILLKRARQLRGELDRERERVRSHGDIARKDDEEIHHLRQTLMGIEKELAEAQERESVLQVEALEFDRRKQSLILEREDAQAAEVARLRPKLERIQTEIKEMGIQIKELVSQYDSLKLEKIQLEEQEAASKAGSGNFSASLAQAKQHLANMEHEPERAQKQLDLVCRSLQGARKELELVDEKIAAQLDTLNKLELQLSNKDNDRVAAIASIQKIRSEMDPKQSTLSTLNASLGMEQELRQGYQERLVELGDLIKSTKASEKEEHNGIEQLRREKERCMNEYKAIQCEQDNLLYAQRSLKEQRAQISTEMRALEAVLKDLSQKIQDLTNTLELRTKRFLIEQAKEEDFTKEAQDMIENLSDIKESIAERLRQEELKRREITSTIIQRQEKSQDCTREYNRMILVKSELQTKESYVRDLQQRRSTLEKRLSALTGVFQKLRHERSHKMMLIERFKQNISEVAEKMKIIEKELVVLKREDYLKEKSLIQKQQQCSDLHQACMNLGLEKNNQRKQMELAADVAMDVCRQVKALNMEVVSVEKTMIQLRDDYTTAIEARNQTGVHLIDLNTEVALLTETVAAQEAALQQGMSMINARSEEERRLKLQLSDLNREIELCQRSVPKAKQLEDELAKLTEDIEDEHWRAEILENDLTDPNNPYRWRKIERVVTNGSSKHGQKHLTTSAVADTSGKQRASEDVSGRISTSAGVSTNKEAATTIECGGISEEYMNLQVRAQALENDLNAINEKLREKELILAEVRDLSERIGAQAQGGKKVTIALAKQVNQYQYGIRNRSRQMMATVSELSLFQASSIQLQQEVARLEQIVEEAKCRLEAGEAPFEEAEQEFKRKQIERQYYAAFQQRQQAAKEAALGDQNNPNVVLTTAELRPNAYIPNDNGLPIPRPFGVHAPFKPIFPTLTSAPPLSGGSGGPVALTPSRDAAEASKGRERTIPSLPLPPRLRESLPLGTEHTSPALTLSKQHPTSHEYSFSEKDAFSTLQSLDAAGKSLPVTRSDSKQRQNLQAAHSNEKFFSMSH
ncbi:unnamed protein product [Phytomonas sp. EM1]|nr:unnamed protein product [Phytomonas sp. EM1]|eukprot:CCW60652.1 unnamed protein product [Phytomonas sp. isolate EM1]